MWLTFRPEFSPRTLPRYDVRQTRPLGFESGNLVNDGGTATDRRPSIRRMLMTHDPAAEYRPSRRVLLALPQRPFVVMIAALAICCTIAFTDAVAQKPAAPQAPAVDAERKWAERLPKLRAYASQELLDQLHRAGIDLGVLDDQIGTEFAPCVGASIGPDAATTDKDLPLLAEVRNLRALNVNGTERITPRGLRAIEKLKELRSLTIDEVSDVDEIMPSVGELTELRTLEVDHVTDVGLRHLSKLQKLKELSLDLLVDPDDVSRNSNVTLALKYIARLQSLRDIHLRDIALNDEQVSWLAELPKLERPPRLHGEKITNAAIRSMARVKTLKELSVQSGNITDGAVEELKGHPSLTALWLDNTA